MPSAYLSPPGRVGFEKTTNLDCVIANYIRDLTETSTNINNFNAYRHQRPQQFFDLCKFHLSILVDLPIEFTDYAPSDCAEIRDSENINARRWSRLFASTSQQTEPTENTGDGYTQDVTRIYGNLEKLMAFLARSDQLTAEGVFRKSGNVGRQRKLNKLILSSSDLEFPLELDPNESAAADIAVLPKSVCGNKLRFFTRSNYDQKNGSQTALCTVHDYASSLKNVLREMQEPILTHELIPIFVSVAELTLGNSDDNGERLPLEEKDLRIAQAKQLKAIRILRILLPQRNQSLFSRFLDLLTLTLKYAESNRMDSTNLGTMFGPVLFTTSGMGSDDLHRQYASMSKLATLMIEQGSNGVFAVPKALTEDVDINVRMETRTNTHGLSGDIEFGIRAIHTRSIPEVKSIPPAICTNLQFTRRSSQKRSADATTHLSETEYAVAQLLDTVKGLPNDDPRKKRFLSHINHSNAKREQNPSLIGKILNLEAFPSTNSTPIRRPDCERRGCLSSRNNRRSLFSRGWKSRSLLAGICVTAPSDCRIASGVKRGCSPFKARRPFRKRVSEENQLSSFDAEDPRPRSPVFNDSFMKLDTMDVIVGSGTSAESVRLPPRSPLREKKSTLCIHNLRVRRSYKEAVGEFCQRRSMRPRRVT